MKNNTLRNVALLLAVILAFSSCASTRVAKDPHAPYLGNWDYSVQDLPVDIDGTMVISKEEGVLKATLVTPMGEAPIGEITIEEGVLKAEFDAEGNFIELEGTFEGNSYKGALFVQGGEFPMTMTKQE
jgi:hypothetical protein